MIISSNDQNLSDIMRDFKKFTSKRIVEELELINESRKEWLLNAFMKSAKDIKRVKHFKVWQDGNQPKELSSNEFIDQKLFYIHNNPVAEGIVAEPEHYLYSSASNYAEQGGLIKVELIS